MRLCILGASHIVALRSAWQAMPAGERPAGLRVSFLPGGRDIGDVVFADGSLRPASVAAQARQAELGETDQVTLADFDAFAVIGVASFRAALNVYAACRGEAHAARGEGHQLVSDACFEAAVAGIVAARAPWWLAARLRTETKAPIAVMAAPMYAASVLRDARFGARFEGLRRDGDEAALAASMERAMRRLTHTDFSLIHQPAETLDSPATTKERFRSGKPVRAAAGRVAAPDVAHMNTAYGRIVLDRLFAFCAGVGGDNKA